MNWMRERDLLIAQTMLFVQSVSAGKPDADKSMAAPEATSRTAATAAIAEVKAVLNGRPVIAKPPRSIPPIQTARPDLREDIQSEIRARIASFRAHQERFLREREAYCSATMAKMRAALRENAEPPRFGK
ncbi:hypothetical protein [Bradyrhizobium sp.]|uniref:hypothetical protein n=1 Tax=Bradyrhizobium sp. TaxID=376 RepID=UPI003C771D3D